jgi:WhiB family transcriptional regulator, redox-sensing transcriptional regulator
MTSPKNPSSHTPVSAAADAPVSEGWADVPEAWMAHGVCRTIDPAMFFPSDGSGVERARRICATCSVTADCLAYALRERIDHGVWGGTSERERRRILRAQRRDGVEAPVEIS